MGFEFEEEKLRGVFPSKRPFFVGILIKSGIVKDEDSANKVLIIASTSFLLITAFVYGYFVLDIGRIDKTPTPPFLLLPTSQ